MKLQMNLFKYGEFIDIQNSRIQMIKISIISGLIHYIIGIIQSKNIVKSIKDYSNEKDYNVNIGKIIFLDFKLFLIIVPIAIILSFISAIIPFLGFLIVLFLAIIFVGSIMYRVILLCEDSTSPVLDSLDRSRGNRLKIFILLLLLSIVMTIIAYLFIKSPVLLSIVVTIESFIMIRIFPVAIYYTLK